MTPLSYEEIARRAVSRPPGYAQDVIESAEVREESRVWLSETTLQRLASKYQPQGEATADRLLSGCFGCGS